MSSDNQYTALGPAAVGFQTDGANIAKGAEVAGTQLGVHGSSPVGVLGQGQGYRVTPVSAAQYLSSRSWILRSQAAGCAVRGFW